MTFSSDFLQNVGVVCIECRYKLERQFLDKMSD